MVRRLPVEGRQTAATRIQRSVRKRSATRARRTGKGEEGGAARAPSSPLTQHYAVAATDRPSILSFRRRCRLFPHPVEMHFRGGILVPMRTNHARILALRWGDLPSMLMATLPLPPTGCHIHPRVGRGGEFFPSKEYEGQDIVVGILHVESGEEAHVVFYEVEVGSWTVHVIDPNGATNNEWMVNAMRDYFVGFDIVLVSVFSVNIDERRGVGSLLAALGFHKDDVSLLGYCATISAFYLIDYACTSQWRRADRRHFLRASQEWMYGPPELDGGQFGARAMRTRVAIFGRYLAYHICLLLGFSSEESTERAMVTTAVRPNGSLATVFSVGTRTKTFVEDDPVDIEGLNRVFVPEGRRISFDEGDDMQNLIDDALMDDLLDQVL